jgi:uncharacterized protein YfaT (DUF1175 family)
VKRVVLLIGLAIVLFAASVFVPVALDASLQPSTLQADGNGSARLVWQARSIYGQPVPYWPWDVRVRVVEGERRLRLVGSPMRSDGPARLEVAFRATGAPGPVRIELCTGWATQGFDLALKKPPADRDADGIPDQVELLDDRDRQAFRGWFTSIAESQFYKPDPRWQQIHRDCAGLLRFAYKEALRRHDASWQAGTAYLHRAANPDVARYNYPQVPIIGERLFRATPGTFRPEDELQHDFSPAASARVLWELNTVFVSKTLDRAQPGDLLFFRDPQRHRAPMHSMILLDRPERGSQSRVVYHTGPDGDEPGEVRLVRLGDLDGHSDARWHVRPDNSNFLGFYRWKILEGGRS